MSGIVKFTETIFSNKNKQGIITPNSDGYYTMVLGGLNTYNSAGEYYVAEGVVQAFESSSHFMRRVRNGALYSELGHPKRVPGMNLEDFYRRIVTVDENNICAHISEVWLDFDFGKKNPGLSNPDFVAIMGLVKPTGPKAKSLQDSLENPKQNTAFSIRGITENNERNGRTERKLTEIITFDNVPEPGIAAACKAHNPGLEHFHIEEKLDAYIEPMVLSNCLRQELHSSLATESNRALYHQILQGVKSSPTSQRIRSW